MKVKKIMLVTLVLLAVLTIGAVSASDNNETLAVSEIGGGQSSDFSTSQDDFNINVTEKNFNDNEGSLSADKEDLIGDYSPDDFDVYNKESKAAVFEDWREIVCFNTPDDFTGDLTLNISNGNGDFKVYSLDKPVDGNEIRRNLGDFDFIDSVGVYELSLRYNGGTQDFEIDQWNLKVYHIDYLYYNEESSGYLNVEYPYEILSLYWDEYPIKRFEINVEGNSEPFDFDESSNMIYLSDLGIDSAGNYVISIRSFDENDDEVEEFVFSLDVKDLNESEFKANVVLSGRSVIYGEDILRIYCPADAQGKLVFNFDKYGDEGLLDSFQREFLISDEMKGAWTPFTLDDLNISEPGNYEMSISNSSEVFAINWLSIDEAYIIRYEYDDGESVYNDSTEKILHIELIEEFKGVIIITVNETEIMQEINDYENSYYFTLSDLNITETGKYNITVKFVSEEGSEKIWGNSILNVIEFNNIVRAIIDSDKRYINFYCPDNAEGNITITVRGEDGESVEFNFEINTTYWGKWNRFYFNDLNISITDSCNIRFELNEYSREKDIDRWVESEIWNGEDERGPLYVDSEGNVIYIHVFDGREGKLYLLVDDEVRFISKFSLDCDYVWNLKHINITEAREYNLTLKFVYDDETYESISYLLNVEEFANDKLRANLDMGKWKINVFCLEGYENITITLYDNDNNQMNEPKQYVIGSDDYNNWVSFSLKELGAERGEEYTVEVNVDDKYSFKQMFSIPWVNDDYSVEIAFLDDDGNLLINSYDVVVTLIVQADFVLENATINITSGNYTFYKNFTEITPRWDNGQYLYEITLEDVDSFRTLNDKDFIIVTARYDDYANGEKYYAKNSREFILKKTTPMRIFDAGVMDEDWIDVSMAEMNEDMLIFNRSSEDLFARVVIPEIVLGNVSEDGRICIYSGENLIFEKYLKNFTSQDMDYDYPSLGIVYLVNFNDLNITGLNDRDVVRIELFSQYFILSPECHCVEDAQSVCQIDGDNIIFYDYSEGVDLADDEKYLGNVETLDYIAGIALPDEENITGYLSIVCGDKVLFNKTFDEIKCDYEGEFSYYNYGYIYRIPKGNLLDELDDGDILKFTLVSDDEVQYLDEKIIKNENGTYLKGIISARDVADWFGITITNQTLINSENRALNLITFDGTNRQTIEWKMKNGYFNVYVNGVKVENLGRLLKIEEGEAPITELELFWLTQNINRDFNLTIDNLGIVDNGEYNIKVTYVPEAFETEELEFRDYTESYVSDLNIVLTSNVKANYQNGSVVWLTGYGLDPVLVYLDTIYNEIDDVTGKVTVLNDNGVKIFESDIKNLPLSNNRRYLSYSDFTDNFGDKITISYTDGNERNGNTILEVKWRNVTSEDFTPSVDDNVNDYYGNFVNLIIPDVVNHGEIIVTIKFKNNHGTNISNMDVNTNFNSEAVYTFNIADIKVSYGNNFALTFNDLGFYEDDGNYTIDIKFTADNTSFLNIVNKTLSVELLECILISINETSRYGIVAPFASIRIFEPLNAYGELYIDDVLYAHKTFEKGWIIFDSSKTWTPGVHTAEVKVFNSEFGSLLNSSKATFKTLIKTDDVNVYVNTTIKENENATIIITVPQAGNLTVIVDNGEKTIYPLVDGQNTIDLGQLSQGNHTVWIEYVNNESTSFYNNYIIITVGDDGSWLEFPERIELNGSDTIKINVGEGVEGYVLIYIDDMLVVNRTLENGTLEISLTQYLKGDNIYGMHNYTIIYYDNNGNMIFSRNGTFYVTYIFHDNIGNEPVPLQDVYIFIVTLPFDATGSVTITVTGNGFKQNYTEPVVNGQAIFYIYDLPLGEYDILVEYSGDAKYPPSSYHTLLNVSYYGIVGDFRDGKRIISLKLPENATGNLVVYNDNRRSEMANGSLVNGRAKVDLTDVPVGIYEIRAVYDGSDYDVKSFSTVFKVLPEVIIAQGITIGENGTIFMDLDNATGYILVVIEGAKPEVQAIADGKLNYTYSTEGFVKGNHTITFQYFGESFDGNVFYTLDEKTGYYVPIEYSVEILPIKVSPKDESNNDTELIIYIYDENANFLPDASGQVEITVLNNFTGEYQTFIVNVVNGIARLSLADLKDGDYSITWNYLGDNRYGSFSRELLLSIKHKQAKITADDLNMLYTDGSRYTVTVYTKDGKPAGNVAVSFFINGKEYSNAITDINGVAGILIDLAPGSYKITAVALGVSVTKKLTVSKILSLKTVKVKRSAKKLVLRATLKKVNGKYLKGKKITFKFNGKKYAAKTNRKGVAKVTIKKKVLKKLKKGKKVTYQATYLKDTVKKTAKIKK